MELLTSVASFALVAGLITITPGIDTALVLRIASRQGRRAGFAAALGVNTGVVVWAVASAVGVSALLTASEVAYTVLRIVGALYMLWLGFGMLRAAFSRKQSPHPPEELVSTPSSVGGIYRTGLLTNIMNPKIGAFYVALLPQFIPEGYNTAAVGTLLAVVHNIEGLLWFSILILLIDKARKFLLRPTVQKWIDGIAGITVVGFGISLALEAK